MADMMDEKVAQSLVDQAHRELLASNTYLAAAFWFIQHNYDGIGEYLMGESMEERKHAIGLFEHLHKRGAKPTVGAIPAVDSSGWQSAADVWQSIVALEVEYSKHISKILLLAREKEDVMVEACLAPYVNEQIESVSNTTQLLEKVKAYASMKGLLYHLDNELGKKARKKKKSDD